MVLCSLLIKWQLKLESSTGVDLADDCDSAFMQVKYALDDGETQAGRSGSWFFAIFGAIKAIENPRYVLIRNATAGIAYSDRHRFWTP